MKNKKYWLFTSVVTLLPMLLGLLLWNQLPEKLPTHFGIDGAADGWGGKGFVVFGIPLMMLAFHVIIFAATRLDKQNRGHNEKVLNLVGLIFPAMSVVMSAIIYSRAAQMELNMGTLLLPLLGLFFIVMGNWLPKIKQNSTLGLKIKWTLYNEENWNKTHRFAGYCWVLGGILFCLTGFLPGEAQLWLIPLQIILLVMAPVVYSWLLAKKQQREGTWTESKVSKNLKKHPVILAVSMVLVAAILTGVGFVMFTGDITYTCTDTALVIEADYGDDSVIPYEQIDAVELRFGVPAGNRVWGFASARLLMGWFENDEFGGYTRYSYVGTDSYIVALCGGDVLVLNAETEDATQALWAELSRMIHK